MENMPKNNNFEVGSRKNTTQNKPGNPQILGNETDRSEISNNRKILTKSNVNDING